MSHVQFLHNGRENLSEMISEKDADFEQQASKFSQEIFSKVLGPMCAHALSQLGKTNCKFVIVCFDLCTSVEERMPYEGVNLGFGFCFFTFFSSHQFSS